MNRRRLLGMMLPLVTAPWVRLGGARLARVLPPDLTLVLRGGRWFAGGAWQTGDIGIDSGGRLRFGPDLWAPELLDISGRVVAPGFIDILADNGANPTRTFPIFEKYKLSDGVTTALQMHGGSADCAAFYAALSARPHAINYGASTFVMVIRGRAADLRERRRQVERNLDQGALGVSHSLEYQPAPYAELLEYARIARRYDRPVFLHLRYSSADGELDGVRRGGPAGPGERGAGAHRSPAFDRRHLPHGGGARPDPRGGRAGLPDHDLRLPLFLLGHLPALETVRSGMGGALRPHL
jgi:hypothetical protein